MRYVHTTGVRLEDGALKMTKVVLVNDLRLPIHIALGRYEAATQEELDELITDLDAERERRAARAA